MMPHLNYLSAIRRAREAYRARLDREIDDHGLASPLLLQLEHDYTYDDLIAWIERSAEYRAREVPTTSPTLTAAAPLPPLTGHLSVDGMAYVDDTGRRIPLMCHVGDLLMLFVEGRLENDKEKEQRVHNAFTDLRDHGYSGLRSWWSIRWGDEPNAYWGSRRLNPSDHAHRQMIAECLRIGAADYGLQWHLALGAAAEVSPHAMSEAWHWLGDIVQAHPTWFALIEGLNEAYHNGESDPEVVERWVNISRHKTPTVLHALSAADGAAGSEEADELKKWTPSWQQVYLVHASRANHWGDQTRHAFSTGYKRAPRRLGWSGEPPGIQWGEHTRVSGMNYPEEWTRNPWRYAFYLAVTALSRQVPTYMCSHGVCLEGRLRDAPGFALAPRLISDLPPDLMAYDELFHGGETHKHRRVIEAPEHCRAEHAKHADGSCVIAVYPERPGITEMDLIFERPWRGRLHDAYGYTDMAIARGATIRRDISNGLLCVGEVL